MIRCKTHSRFRRRLFALILISTSVLAGACLAQPRLETFVFPVDTALDLWRVDVYMKAELDWITQADTMGNLHAVVSLDNNGAETIAEQVCEIGTNERRIIRQKPGQYITSFRIKPGDYKLSVCLRNEAEKPIFGIGKRLMIEPGDSRARMSDLVPVDFPGLAEPPFQELFWVEDNRHAFDFFLYYEVCTAATDTTIQLRSSIENENGEILREDTYSLSVYGQKRQDYVRVDLFGLPEGTYLVRLKVEDSQPVTQKHFRFSAGRFSSNLTGAVLSSKAAR